MAANLRVCQAAGSPAQKAAATKLLQTMTWLKVRMTPTALAVMMMMMMMMRMTTLQRHWLRCASPYVDVAVVCTVSFRLSLLWER